MMVDVIVLNYNDSNTTKAFVELIMNYSSVGHILIVDNASTDRSVEAFIPLLNERVLLLKSSINGGYGAGNNLGIKELCNRFESEIILISNPDVIIENSTIHILEEFLRKHQDYVIAAPYMLDSNREKANNTALSIPSGIKYALTMDLFYSKYVHPCRIDGLAEIKDPVVNVDVVAGSCFMINANLMQEYGMFDENIFLYCEEMALGIKLKQANLKTALLPNIHYVHNHSVSIDKTFHSEIKKKRLLVKSKLYVLKEYFHFNSFELCFAYLIAILSIIEVFILTVIKRIIK